MRAIRDGLEKENNFNNWYDAHHSLYELSLQRKENVKKNIEIPYNNKKR